LKQNIGTIISGVYDLEKRYANHNVYTIMISSISLSFEQKRTQNLLLVALCKIYGMKRTSSSMKGSKKRLNYFSPNQKTLTLKVGGQVLDEHTELKGEFELNW
jgi:hypothetical protein